MKLEREKGQAPTLRALKFTLKTTGAIEGVSAGKGPTGLASQTSDLRVEDGLEV